MNKQFKTIGIIIFLLAVLAITIYLGRRVSLYLARASACPAAKIEASKVSPNSAIISWTTEENTQGRVEYGTSATNLTFSNPETQAAKEHNIPLTLLTPNTIYYYLITIGKNRCDSKDQACTDNCIPWSFTTTTLTPQTNIVETIPPQATGAAPGASTVAPTKAVAKGPSPTSALSSYCLTVAKNIGASSQDTVKWPTVKQYDIDSNGVINGLDIIKCQKAGK